MTPRASGRPYASGGVLGPRSAFASCTFCRMVQRSALVFQSRARLERILTALPANLGHNAMERGARNEMRGAGNERALGPLSSNVQITAVPFAQARRRTAASAAVPAMGRSQPT
jgi:hypothetical protein